MKKAFMFSFCVIFLLSISSVLAQSKVSATSTQDEEAAVASAKTQKVSKIRKVVIVRDLIQLQALPNSEQMKTQSEAQQSRAQSPEAQQLNALQKVEEVQYDSKGGIIVPNASKGIRITPQNSQKAAKISKVQTKSRNKTIRTSDSDQTRYQKDLSKRNTANQAATKTKKQKDN